VTTTERKGREEMKRASVLLVVAVLALGTPTLGFSYESYQLNWYDADFFSNQGSVINKAQKTIVLTGQGVPWQTMLKWKIKLEGQSVYALSFQFTPTHVGDVLPVDPAEVIVLKIKTPGGETLVEKNVSLSNQTAFFWSYAVWQGLEVEVDLMMGHLKGGLAGDHAYIFRVGKPTQTGDFISWMDFEISSFSFYTETGSTFDIVNGDMVVSVYKANEKRWATMAQYLYGITVSKGFRYRFHITGWGCNQSGKPGTIVAKFSSQEGYEILEKSQTLLPCGAEPQEIVFDVIAKNSSNDAKMQLFFGLEAGEYRISSLWVEVFTQ